MPWPSGIRARFSVEESKTRGKAGDRTTPMRGEGIEADTLRPWADGDPARAIDWRATARMDAPWVRSRHDDREMPITVILDDVPADRFPNLSDTLGAAARWLLQAANGAAYPVGVVVRREGRISVVRPGRGRKTLRAALALVDGSIVDSSRGSAAGSLADAMEALTPGAAVLVSAFDIRPGEKDGLLRVIHEASRRTSLIPVRIESPSMDPTNELPKLGVIELQDARGDRRLVDSTSSAVREAWAKGLIAREAFVQELEARMSPGVRIESGDRTLAPLLARFSRRISRRSGRVGGLKRAVSILLTATGMLLGAAADGKAQSSLQRPEVIGDRISESGALGTPLRRTMTVRWANGPATGARLDAAGEEVDVRLHAVSADGTDSADWVIELDYIFWELGEQRLPALRLEGRVLDDPLEIRPRRVRIEAPAAPPSGLGPTLPVLPPPAFPAWLRWLFPALGGVAALALVLPRAGSLARSGAVAVRSFQADRARPVDPLDQIVAEVRTALEALAGPHPGWTGGSWQRWSDAALSSEAVRLMEDIRVRVDERRFRPDPPSDAEIRQARSLADRLGVALKGATLREVA